MKRKLLLAVVVCSLVMLAGTSTAAAATPTLKSLAKSVAALQKKTKSLNAQLKAAKATIAAQDQTITSLQSKLTADEVTIAAHTQTLTDASSLLAIAPYVSLTTTIMNGVNGPNIVFEGANVHVRSADSETDGTGTGNLIVGWNNAPGTVARGGSNNLVAGDYNNFNSCGGFVCGMANTLNSRYCSISGGSDNGANAESACVSGGRHNSANGYYSSVCGGSYNTTTASYASIGGGISLTLALQDAWGAGGSTQTVQYLTKNP